MEESKFARKYWGIEVMQDQSICMDSDEESPAAADSTDFRFADSATSRIFL